MDLPPSRRTLTPDTRKRYTYSLAKAKDWFPVLQSLKQAVVDGGEGFISSQDSGRTPTTLLIILNDVVRYLLDHGNAQDKEWARDFRASVAIRKVQAGVVALRKRKSVPGMVYVSPLIAGKTVKPQSVAINEIKTWFEKAMPEDIRDFTNLDINEHFKTIILNIISQSPTAEIQWGENTARIMK